MKNIVNNALNFVETYFENDSSGHDYYHTFRVYQTAVRIAYKENADVELTSLIALLHDVDDHKLVSNNECSELYNTKRFLLSENIDNETIELICSEISKISYNGTGDNSPNTLEGKIAQDADRLDAIGAIGIARAFTYGGNKSRPLYLPKDENNISTISHFYNKLLKLSSLMNTETAKKTAAKRHAFLQEFLTEFMDEIDEIK